MENDKNKNNDEGDALPGFLRYLDIFFIISDFYQLFYQLLISYDVLFCSFNLCNAEIACPVGGIDDLAQTIRILLG